MPLTIVSTETQPRVFVLKLAGSLDSNTHADLDKRIAYLVKEGGAKIITLDMAGVNFLTSLGVRTLFKAERDLKATHGQLILVNIQPPVKKVLEVINALPSMQIFSSIEEMDAYLANIQAKTSGNVS